MIFILYKEVIPWVNVIPRVTAKGFNSRTMANIYVSRICTEQVASRGYSHVKNGGNGLRIGPMVSDPINCHLLNEVDCHYRRCQLGCFGSITDSSAQLTLKPGVEVLLRNTSPLHIEDFIFTFISVRCEPRNILVILAIQITLEL